MEGYREVGCGHFALHFEAAGLMLWRLLRGLDYGATIILDVAEVLLGEGYELALVDVGRYGKYCARGAIVQVVEGAHVVQGGALDMFGRYAYCRPAVGVYLVTEVAQEQLLVAIGLIEVSLLELLDYHLLLDVACLLADVEVAHAVALQPQGGAYVLLGQGDVEVGVVVVREGVVLATGHLYRYVEVGNLVCASEHEVLE